MTDVRASGNASVFARVVAIMFAMAVCLLILVTAVYWLVMPPEVHALISRDRLHVGLLILLFVVILAVVLTAHAFLRHLLRPLRELSDGVQRLSDGELDVELRCSTHDEFGRLTDAFNYMVRRVRDMIGVRDQLLIDVSHELRSPLTRMKVTLEMLPEDEHRLRLAEDIVDMERMVTTLLELERLRSGHGLSFARTDLIAMVHEIAGKFQDGPPGVRVVSAEPVLLVDVDAEKMRTVLRNLSDNAVKYSLPGSGPIEVRVERAAGAAVVRVTDEGAGIPDGDLARIFEPFYRVDLSRSKDTGGYGLGLSICKRVMEAHGGSITVTRGAGGGTSFTLTLPTRD